MKQHTASLTPWSIHSVPMTQAMAGAWVRSFDSQACLAWFDPSVPDWQAERVGNAGRGSAWFMTLLNQPVVLRHYRRGGMVARISRDLYVWQGLAASRSFWEWDVLATLCQAGLPVARPVAALVQRVGGLFYRAALITERINQAQPLWQFTEPEVWRNAGAVIAQMHQMGVWHADLNVNNIQVDGQGKVWLIDFDRAKLNQPPGHLRGNLERLQRSVTKVVPNGDPRLWSALLHGYDQVML